MNGVTIRSESLRNVIHTYTAEPPLQILCVSVTTQRFLQFRTSEFAIRWISINIWAVWSHCYNFLLMSFGVLYCGSLYINSLNCARSAWNEAQTDPQIICFLGDVIVSSLSLSQLKKNDALADPWCWHRLRTNWHTDGYPKEGLLIHVGEIFCFTATWWSFLYINTVVVQCMHILNTGGFHVNDPFDPDF